MQWQFIILKLLKINAQNQSTVVGVGGERFGCLYYCSMYCVAQSINHEAFQNDTKLFPLRHSLIWKCWMVINGWDHESRLCFILFLCATLVPNFSKKYDIRNSYGHCFKNTNEGFYRNQNVLQLNMYFRKEFNMNVSYPASFSILLTAVYGKTKNAKKIKPGISFMFFAKPK